MFGSLLNPGVKEDQPMRSRPTSVTVAAILLVLLSLFGFPWPWQILFSGTEDPPAFIYYSGIVLGIVGLLVVFGLWTLKTWGFWATIIVAVLNLLLGAPGIVLGPNAGIRVTSAVLAIVTVLIIVLVVLPSSRRALATAHQPSRVR
jgi:hypothetical protein